ncbi:uncharacterized protein RCO7_02730 [Rhynchosporium graminicola]|uniref:Uncharacterized protein n=1 Tax=Rhynchosporium graminicola TaxID=2792576 RepID=A0A1E1KGB2_9HELO|nr:uncharacterized protein RCO7_02730 [Rhynchosporium commune]
MDFGTSKYKALHRRLWGPALVIFVFVLGYLRLYVWNDRTTNILAPGRVASFDNIVLEPEWEWARNTSIVYTWVNGSEPEFRKRRTSDGGQITGGDSLDTDDDELLYSLRSIWKHIPWHTGKIYIVTQNQIPTWLKTSNPRIKIVDHNNIIPGEYLPTYNSNVIDSYLHLIPGLTDIFLYFNDDVFVSSPLHPSDLFTAECGLKLFVERLTIPISETQQRLFIDGVKDKAYWRAFFSTVQLMEDTFGARDMKPLRLLQHTSHAFHRGAIERVHHLWIDEFRTAHKNKFREDDDIIFIYAYYGYLAHRGWDCCNLTQEAFETEGGGNRISFLDDTTLNARAIEKLRGQRRAKFLNTNDMMGYGADAHDAREQLRDFLWSSEKSLGLRKARLSCNFMKRGYE